MSKQNMFFEKAKNYLPGGVTAAARLNKYNGKPFPISKAEGSKIYDLGGRKYIDMCMSYGASLLGHGHPNIIEALKKAGNFGIGCGMEFREQAGLAEAISGNIPSAELVRFTLSGTETTQYAVKLARIFTGKKKIVKIEGHFHGFNDYLQFNYWPKKGQGLPNVYPETDGVPPDSQQQIIVVPFNDLEIVAEALERHADEVAAVMLEPVNFNSGGIRPSESYLRGLRELTEKHGVLLIFDEILSGFRTGTSCMQGYYGVTPDITTLGKALGGGTPLSAFVGKREVMSSVSPEGPMMHSGTYNANSVNIFCGAAFMEVVGKKNFYPEILERSQRLYNDLNKVFTDKQFPARVQGLGARFGLLFGAAAAREPVSYDDVVLQDWDLAHAFFMEIQKEGVYFNHGWHHGISIAHSDDDIESVINAAENAVNRIKDTMEG